MNGALWQWGKNERELAVTSQKFEFRLQWLPCGSPSSELSDLVSQLGVEMSVNCKQTNFSQAKRVLKVWLLKNWGLLENHQVLGSVVRLLRVPDQENNTEKVANRL